MDIFAGLERAFESTHEPRARASLLEMMSQGSSAKLPSGQWTVFAPIKNDPGAEQQRIVTFMRGALRDKDAGVPACLVRGLGHFVSDEDGPGARAIQRSATDDLFR